MRPEEIRPYSRDYWYEKRRRWALEQQATRRGRNLVAAILGGLCLVVAFVCAYYVFSDAVGDTARDYLNKVRRELAVTPRD